VDRVFDAYAPGAPGAHDAAPNALEYVPGAHGGHAAALVACVGEAIGQSNVLPVKR
jgi:hypothetical protein